MGTGARLEPVPCWGSVFSRDGRSARHGRAVAQRSVWPALCSSALPGSSTLGHILLSWLGRFYTSLCHSYRQFLIAGKDLQMYFLGRASFQHILL